MATVRQVYTRALRKLRVIASGETPTSEELSDGASVVQGIFNGWIENGMFGRFGVTLSDSIDDLDYFTADGRRYEVTLWESPADDDSIELPVRVVDPETGRTTTPPDLAIVELVDETAGTRKTYIYDARVAAWVKISDMTPDSTCPLSGRSLEGIAALVATRVADEFGATPGALTLREAGEFVTAIASRAAEAPTTGTAAYY